MPQPPILLTSSYKHELGSQEEWDPNTVLYQHFEVEQILMPDNAHCLAVQAFLKMLRLPFTVDYQKNAEYMSPSGKIPFIRSGQFVLAELEPIVDFVQSKDYSLTKNLDKTQLSDMRAFMSLVTNVLGNAESYMVWCDPETEPNTKQRCGSAYPFPLNHWITYMKKRAVKSKLNAVGWLQKTVDEVYDEVDRCCKALSDRLGDSPYFFNVPTELDALLFGHIFTILTTVLPTNRFAAIVRGYSNLIDHCTRIEGQYFNFSKTADNNGF